MKMSEIVNNFGESLVTGALVMLICVALLSLWSNIRALVLWTSCYSYNFSVHKRLEMEKIWVEMHFFLLNFIDTWSRDREKLLLVWEGILFSSCCVV